VKSHPWFSEIDWDYDIPQKLLVLKQYSEKVPAEDKKDLINYKSLIQARHRDANDDSDAVSQISNWSYCKESDGDDDESSYIDEE
jgi:hypothetical protein